MVNWVKLVSVFCITTLIFLVGLLAGNYLSSIQSNILNDMRNDIYAEVASSEALYSFMADDPCNTDISSFSGHLDKMNDRLKLAEEKVGWKAIENLKSYYFATEIKHFLLVGAMNEKCKSKYTPLFYFYSNERCAYCLEQGIVLSDLKASNTNLMVYAFDAYNPSTLVSSLKVKYNVTELPAVVIDGVTYSGFQSKDKLKGIWHLK